MGNALIVQELDGVDELSEQGSADLGWESSFLGNEVEKLTFSVLKYDDGSFLDWLRCELNIAVKIRFDDAHEVLEFEFFKKLNLSFEAFFLVKAKTINFNSIKFICFATKIDTENKWKKYLACPPYPRRKWSL